MSTPQAEVEAATARGETMVTVEHDMRLSVLCVPKDHCTHAC